MEIQEVTTQEILLPDVMEGWIKSCVNEFQLENMIELVYDKVENVTRQDELINLIKTKIKSLEGEFKA